MATAQSNTMWNNFKYLTLGGYANCRTDTFKAVLVTTGFTQNIDDDYGLANITYITSNLQNSGVETLTSTSVNQDDTNNAPYFTSAPVTFTATGAVTAIGMVIYDDTVASPTADPLACYVLFDATKTLASGDTLTITPPATGSTYGWWKV